MNKYSVFFDLDGTLIDSRQSIEASLKIAFQIVGMPLPAKWTGEMIGPPFEEILDDLLGKGAAREKIVIKNKFKEIYDGELCLSAKNYVGLKSILLQLARANFDLYLLTNKRLKPTLKILNHLDISNFFRDIYSTDEYRELHSKQDVIESILATGNLKYEITYLIGDSEDDRAAARAIGANFIHANWGYGKLKELCDVVRGGSLQESVDLILGDIN